MNDKFNTLRPHSNLQPMNDTAKTGFNPISAVIWIAFLALLGAGVFVFITL